MRVRLDTAAAIDVILDMSSFVTGGNGNALRAVAGAYAAITSAFGFPIELDATTYWAGPGNASPVTRW
jgi:hypothetical protein